MDGRVEPGSEQAMSAGFAPGAHAAQNSSERRAALTVHALTDQDRQWLMAQLTPDEAERLHPLLKELQQLGIPRDAGLLEQHLRADPHLETAASQSHPLPVDGSEDVLRQPVDHGPASDDVRTLDQADAADLARMLNHEPPVLVAHLLHMQHWSWASDLLSQLDESQRHSVQSCLTELRESLEAPPSALHQALMAAVVQRLQQLPKPCATATPAPVDADHPLTPSQHMPAVAWSRVKNWARGFNVNIK